MTRVAFVRSHYPTSEPRSLNILKALDAFEPTAILWNRDSALTPDTRPDWKVMNKPAGYGMKMLLKLPVWWIFVFRTLARTRPELVHACNIDSCIPTYLYALIFRKRYVYDIWDTTGGMFAGNNKRIEAFCNWFDRFLIKRSAFFCLPDEERVKQLGYSNPKRVSEKLFVLPNSQAHHDYKTRSLSFGKPLKLLYSGIMSRSIRGLEHLIEATKTNKDLDTTIIGYGPDENFLRELCGDEPRLHFLGKQPREKVEKLLEKSDCIVTLLDPAFPNYQYATSTKLFEAFAHGLPVITTQDTATGRLTEKTKWGFTIPYTAPALAELLTDLTSKKELTLELDPARVTKYDWTEISKHLADRYSKLLSR